MSIETNINRLINYGIHQGLMAPADIDDVANKLLDLLQVKSFSYVELVDMNEDVSDILDDILSDAVCEGVLAADTIDERDLFDTKMMGCLMPRSSEVNAKFERYYQKAPKEATDYFYQLSRASDYIGTDRTKKDKQ